MPPAAAPLARLRVRCLVPIFCEYADTKPRKTPVWFALAEDRPLFAFAGPMGLLARRNAGRKSAAVKGMLQTVRRTDDRGKCG
jgi:putative SOS response-associated peptidase YedK